MTEKIKNQLKQRKSGIKKLINKEYSNKKSLAIEKNTYMLYPVSMYVISKKSSLNGSILVPGSKSQTIRAVFMALLADGNSTINNPLPSSDGLSAFNAAVSLGAKIQKTDNKWHISGLNGILKAPASVIDTGNSGTTTSFVTGLCTLIDGFAVITGDEQICSRPVRPAINAFSELGANCFITRPDSDCPPIVVGGKLHGGICHLPGMNSQHVSAILVPGALIPAEQNISIEVENPKETSYIQMTIEWMKKFGVEAQASSDFKHYKVSGGQKYKAAEVTVSSDWSGVAFPLVAAVCTQSNVTITGLNFSDPQADKQIIDILIKMGACIEKDTQNGTVKVCGGKPLLNDITIDMNDIPDALPALCIAACYSSGKTTFTTLAHIRQKESDRVSVMTEELTKCGTKIECSPDSMTIFGGNPIHGAEIDSRKDHRIAMAMAVCGMFCQGQMKISDAECADVSFPGFYELFKTHGADFQIFQ